MHLRSILIICIWALGLLNPGQLVSAQASGFVSGTIIDAGSKEPLIAVNVSVERRIGTATDLNGAFSLKLDEGQHILVFSYLGYLEQQKEITISEGETLR